MRALVTGGAGFIGSHIADALLARGDEVTVLDDLSSGKRQNVPEQATFIEADVREAAAPFAETNPEICFHFAAQMDVRVSVARPEHDASINVLGTIAVLEAAREHRTKVVFASTGGAIYGEREEAADESSPREPLSPYGTSKLAAEEYLNTYNRLYGSEHVSLRLGNVYGPRQDPHGEAGVVAIFFNGLRDGTSLRIFGDGKQTRDYIFVHDVVRGALAADRARGGVFNIGTGRETSVLELFDLCSRISGVAAEPERAPAREGELQRTFLDSSLAVDELGWRPERSLEDGLRETWEWFARKD